LTDLILFPKETPLDFTPGQRWHSLTEPELGLGLIEAVEGRQVVIAFPARAVTRRYSTQDPPLVRAQLTAGQQARSHGGSSFCIEEVVEADALFLYRGEGQELSEAELDAELDVATPENRMRSGQVDDFRLFDLRHDALAIRHRMLSSPVRGLVGGRIRFFDHQLSIAHTVCERHQIRVLLADEVGLGKTIEALLILHRLLLTGRVENALIMVPPALVHQWLAEAYLRFNLVLNVLGKDTYSGDDIEAVNEELSDQLSTAQLFVCPLGTDIGDIADELAQIPWDITIVDEAHHLEPGSANFSLVEEIAQQTEHVVLLSATPDRNGQEAHFHRLALLDPARFHDMKAYYREAENYRELATVAERLQQSEALGTDDLALLKQRLPTTDLDGLANEDRPAQLQLLSRLLDLHGLGRVMFRNVRARIPGFPRRVPLPIEWKDGDLEPLRREFLSDIGRDETFQFDAATQDPRTAWLADFLAAHEGEKVLVLCSDRSKVEAFALALTTPQCKVARFHEAMGSIERDRQAAYFLDKDGPQVVISSAIGAEGRNFQVARHLVLLDLPLSADRLEQAIGRVDRIGQGFEIYIYAIAVEGTPQARLRRWFLEALRVFERPWHGSPAIEREFGPALVEALLAPDETAIDELIERGRARNEEIIAELETGRDRLLELSSFDSDAAELLQKTIARQERDGELESFMLGAFERSGLDIEAIGPRSYAVRAGMDYHHPFPGFVGEEMGVTFDRATALTHPERIMLTWDHPMVRDSVDMLLAHETGNASVAQCKGPTPGLLLEALYVVETTLDAHLRADRFLPPTPMRIVVDMSGEETDTSKLRDTLEAADSSVLAQPQVGALLSKLLEKTRTLASDKGAAIAAKASEKMRTVLEPEALRLLELSRVNSAIGEGEIAAAHAELETLVEGLNGARVRLDGLRLVLIEAE
jgi:ATP-dependent helicase HepA